jgi:nitrate reductase gamma subunit
MVIIDTPILRYSIILSISYLFIGVLTTYLMYVTPKDKYDITTQYYNKWIIVGGMFFTIGITIMTILLGIDDLKISKIEEAKGIEIEIKNREEYKKGTMGVSLFCISLSIIICFIYIGSYIKNKEKHNIPFFLILLALDTLIMYLTIIYYKEIFDEEN